MPLVRVDRPRAPLDLPVTRAVTRAVTRVVAGAVTSAVVGAVVVSGPVAAQANSSAPARAASSGPAAAFTQPTAPPTGQAPATPIPPVPVVDEAAPVQVVVDVLAPRAPSRPDEPVQVTGRLVNRGSSPVRELDVRLLVGGVLTSRSALARAADDPGTGQPRGPEVQVVVDELAPGDVAPFDLRLSVADLRLGRLGVYPVQVQVRGRSDGQRRAPLGAASTFVPWFPDGPPQPTRLSFALPLVGVPERAPDGALLGTSTREALSDGGRLDRLLETGTTAARGACDPPATPDDPVETAPASAPCRGEAVPVTWAADPDLLETAQALSGDHLVLGPQGERSPAPGVPDAAAWLDRLRSGVTAGQDGGGTPEQDDARPADLVALPHGDPDVVAVVRAGAGLAGDLEQLSLLGARTVAQLTGADPVETVAWPPAGRLSAAALDVLAAAGGRAVVLDPVALPTVAPGARTPGARTPLSATVAGRVDGLVADAALSALLTAGPDDPGWQGDRLAEQRWLAETAIIAAERPGESRTLVVAPPRRAELRPEVAGAALLDAGRLPWLCAVPLVDVAAGTEQCPAPPADRPGQTDDDRADADADVDVDDRGRLEPADGEGELSPAFLAQAAAVRARAVQLTDEVLVAGTEPAVQTRSQLLQARGRVLSSAWRQDPVGGRQMLALQREEVDRLRSQVSLVTSGRVLLTSDTGVVEVGLANALEQPVTVGVALNDPVEARLTSSDTGVQTVGPGQQVQVRVRVEARVSGQFVLRATLLDRSGEPFGEPVELVARSTRYGRLALAVTGVAAGVLLVAVGVRLARRALRAASGRAAA